MTMTWQGDLSVEPRADGYRCISCGGWWWTGQAWLEHICPAALATVGTLRYCEKCGSQEDNHVCAVPERESVLTEAERLVHGDRNAAYGHPLDDMTRTAGMASAMLAGKLREPLTAEDVCMLMVCVKLSRQVNRPKRDNCTDGAGYFECLQWMIDERERRARQ